MTLLTDKELTLLKFITKESSFNFDRLDLTKSFEEQHLENKDYFISFVEIEDYSNLLNTTSAGARAILGSLTKKKLCHTVKDTEQKPVVHWLYINKDEFNNIKEVLKQQEVQ